MVRPTGANSTYPPTISTGQPQGYRIQVAGEDGKTLVVDMTRTLTVEDAPGYARWIGSLRRQIEGSGQVWVGAGLWEQFSFLE